MRDQHKLQIYAAIFLIGGALQMFKSFQWNSSIGKNPNEIHGHELKTFDFEPFHVGNGDRSATKSHSGRKAIAQYKSNKDKINFAKDHTFGETPKKQKSDKKKKKKKDKKKKKKTVVKTKEDTSPNIYDSDYEERDKDSDTPGQSKDDTNMAGGGGPTPPKNNSSDTEIPQSTEEWLKILLAEPDYKQVMQFVDYYQSRLISASVFYEVLTAMAEDNREEMNTLAVTAAGSTPSHHSFLFLTSMITGSSSHKVRGSAQEQISIYKNLQYLNVLKSIVVDTESTSASLFAANLIALSAKQNLQPSKNMDEQAQNTPPGNTPQPSNLLIDSIKRNYELTRELLTSIISRSQDNNLTSALQEAIIAIDESLKT